MIDVISPCVTFNDHEGSTKSYAYAKEHDEALGEVNFVPFFEDISVEYDPGTTTAVTITMAPIRRRRARFLSCSSSSLIALAISIKPCRGGVARRTPYRCRIARRASRASIAAETV